MWLARQQKRPAAEAAAGVGEVTLGGSAPAVELDSERRGLTVYAPGGYHWCPAPAQQVLVLKAEGEPCVVGTAVSKELAPGEVELNSGSAQVRLDLRGRVSLGPTVAVTGSLLVGGVELTQLVRSIAEETVKEQMGKDG